MAMTIGSNAGLYQLLNVMNRLEAERTLTMARLSTGQRINRASDDPAGLIALQALRSEAGSVDAALSAGARTQSFLNVADSTLIEVGKLTSEIEELVLTGLDSTTTAEEKAAYQAQIDANIDAIDRLVNQAEFNGRRIFNGENRIIASTDDADAIRDIKVYSRNPGQTGAVTLNITVTAAATYAYSNSSTGYLLSGSTLGGESTLQITGKLGTAVVTIASGSNGAAVLAAVNAESDVTGVSAFEGDGGRLTYMSTEKGSKAFVTVAVISGPQAMVDGGGTARVSGTDAAVTINGRAASASGTEVYYSGNGLSLSFTLNDDTPASHTITVTGGGATFTLGTDLASRVTLGFGGLSTHELGRSDLGYLDSLRSGGANSLTASGGHALAIAQEATRQVTVMAGRLGAFNTYQVGSAMNSLNAAREGLAAAISAIADTDYAVELSKLDRQNLLMSAAVSMLSLANARAAGVLDLLR